MPDALDPDAPDPDASHPDRSRSALSRLGAGLGHHPGRVVVTWVLLVLLGFAAASGAFGNERLFDRLSTGEPTVPGENETGRDLIADAGSSGFQTITVRVDGVQVASPAVAAAAREAAQQVGALPGVTQVASPFVVPGGLESPAATTMLKGGSAGSDGYVTVATVGDLPDDAAYHALEDRVTDTVRAATAGSGATVTAGGVRDLVDAITGQLEVDLRTGEGIALPVSFIVMVIVFGGFIAAGMPIAGAIASIAGALASLLGFSYLIDLDTTAVNVVTVLGLGLCIDYGLLVVSRFREELRSRAAGMPVAQIPREMVVDATARTVDSAGRTVVFSGLTVAISLGGLLVFQSPLMKGIGAAGVSVVVIAVLVALTLVPALCVLGARRLLRKGTESAPEHGVFSRLAQWVHRFPIPIIAVVASALLALAAPALDLRLTSSGAQLLPVSAPERVFFDGLAKDYPVLGGADVTVVAEAPLEQAQRYAADLRLPQGSRVLDVKTLQGSESMVRIDVPGGPLEQPARDVVDQLRHERPAFQTYVVGQASGLKDFTDSMWERAPYAFALVALATLVLLFLMTGSVVIPVKALLLNVVSLGASLGIVVLVFQKGHLEGLLGFDSVGAVESTIPLLVLAFGFGLSMDYEVFLLSRIVELHERGYSNDDAVVVGLQRSGRIITSAALLVVIVFSGFVAGQLLIIKQTGVGLATAVALDATLVRMLLVPATMTLLGDWNWWAPRRLRGLHARFGITE
ncbi:putative drug exporter of the RND superfamily [Pedococcus dokdonensis]|uniref:Putative drug exporter of the RND superfamily n=1 Tax=Pedococcus dokdonensis TaxID=443156 RepID=A0A1H0PN18_9MICO|nr:MMPL family transporter [Pedococcus dokdonensis]SDP05988.1 putative drug exporter of the RND superfamily [Pedococcus dokdonensis]